jgi:hypothetical protein
MEINLQNIEELIFFDKKAHALFPEFRHFFDQWQLGQRIPGMKTLGQRSVLELLNSLDEIRIRKLEEYFSDTILVDKIDHRLAACYDWQIGEADELCEFTGYRDFCIHRDKDRIYATFWR